MRPWVVPAMTAIVRAPMAQRETVPVMRSQTSSQMSASAGFNMLWTTPCSFDMSTSRKSARNSTVKSARPTENAWPATPRRAEIASGIVAERSLAPSWTFSAAPESPAHESSSESRSWATRSGRSFRKSRTELASGTSRIRARTVAAAAEPRTTIVAESPRPRPVRRMNARTGISKTRARKMPRKTRRSASRIEMTAHPRKTMSAAMSSDLTEMAVSRKRRVMRSSSP